MKKQDNKGFTLVELLVAVMVLAIVVIPMLHSFVTSYRVNAKSKQIMRATALAQNEMEIFEKEKIENLKAMTVESDPTKLVYDVTVSDGRYVFKREKTVNDESGREMFDVVVDLDPEHDAGERYEAQNAAKVIQMNTISNLDSGSHVQDIGSQDGASGYDAAIYDIFNAREDASGYGANWTKDDFEQKLKRRIIVNVSQTSDSLGLVTKAKVTYEYTCEEDGVVPDEYRVYTEEMLMFDNAQSFDTEGKRVELKSLYLFYAPRYNSTKVDEIVIENEAKLPIDFYVVRQDIREKTSNAVIAVPLTYQAKISVFDGINGDNTCGKYWTNLNLAEAEIEGNGKHTKVSLTDLDNPAQYYDETASMTKTGLKKLGYTEAKDRIYTMTVKVYKTGADPATEPLVTMTGSKME